MDGIPSLVPVQGGAGRLWVAARMDIEPGRRIGQWVMWRSVPVPRFQFG